MEVVYVIICCQNKGLCPIQRFDGTACEQGFEIEIPPQCAGVFVECIKPLFIMIIMAIVFSKMFTRASITNFPVYLMSGQVMFNFMNLSTKSAIQSINGSASLLKKTYVPKYVFTVSKLSVV